MTGALKLCFPTRRQRLPMQDLSVADFVGALEVCGLLDGPRAGALKEDLRGRFGHPHALARELVARGWLTPYQVNRLVQGRGRELLLGPYVLLDGLGRGSLGQLFKARERLTGRVVALKALRPGLLAGPEAAARLCGEVEAAARAEHPNLVRVHNLLQVGDAHLLVMEYVESTDLGRLVRGRGALPVAQACDFARQALLGLQHAHERGLAHRDLRPSRLLLAAGEPVIKVLGLGLARLRHEAALAAPAGMLMDAADYLAPEQAEGFQRADTRADLYSMGCALHYLLTGRPPFAGATPEEKLLRHREIDPIPLEALRPEAPRALGDVQRRLMAKRPGDRYRTAAEAAAALAPFCATGPEGAYAAPPVLPAALPPADLSQPGSSTAGEGSTADLDRVAVGPAPPASPALPLAPQPARRRRRVVLGLGLGAVLLVAGGVLVAQVVLRITDRRGRTTEVSVAPGSKVAVGADGDVKVTLPPRKSEGAKPAPGGARGKGRDVVPPQVQLPPAAAGPEPEFVSASDRELVFKETFDGEWLKRVDYGGYGQGNGYAYTFGAPMPAMTSRDPLGCPPVDHFECRLRVWFRNCELVVHFRQQGNTFRRHMLTLTLRDSPTQPWSLMHTVLRPQGGGSWQTAVATVVAQAKPSQSSPIKEGRWIDLRILARGRAVEVEADGRLLTRLEAPFAPGPTLQAYDGVTLGRYMSTPRDWVALATDYVYVWRLKPPAEERAAQGPPADGELVFEDTFDDPAKEFVQTSDKGESGRKNGQYYILMRPVPVGQGGQESLAGPPVDHFRCDLRVWFSRAVVFLDFRHAASDRERHKLFLAFLANDETPWRLVHHASELREGAWSPWKETFVAQGDRAAGAALKEDQWNDVTIIARGRTIELVANGVVLKRLTAPFEPGATLKPSLGVVVGIWARTKEYSARLAVNRVFLWRLKPAPLTPAR